MARLDRARITEAALAIVEADGSGGLTLTAIARRLEVTQPALYYHLGGIDDVLRWVGLQVRTDLVAALTAASVGRSGADAVHAVAVAWRNFSRVRPAAYRSTQWFPVQGDVELEAAVGRVLQVLADSLRGFDLADGERTTAALALRAMLHGFVTFELGVGNPGAATPDATFGQVVDLFVTGIRALEGPRTPSV